MRIMIGKLRGLIDSSDSNSVLLDVNGVGYHVFCALKTLQKLPANGEAATLIIETHVREDYIHLYGFTDNAERDWFRLLITVKGIGAKVALSLLSVLSTEQLSSALAAQDKAALAQANGVSIRLAERILVELKDKTITSGNIGLPMQDNQPVNNTLLSDAVSALTNLGYGRTEAHMAVTETLKESPSSGLSDSIRLSLKRLAK